MLNIDHSPIDIYLPILNQLELITLIDIILVEVNLTLRGHLVL